MALLAVITALCAAAPDEETYFWPLELPRVLTSSFAEYRPGRFHMGIDLRTGPIGKNVYAAADGHVSRIRCSPYGYGKAVYLQLDDGYSVVYAHLDDFAPELRDYVRAAQHARKSYTVDLQPGPGQFRVTRGQFIAKSGQTGIGVPHLHYEIRDPAGRPVNPRLLGIAWPDDTAPVFRKAVLVPGAPEAFLDGDILPIVLDVSQTAPGQYRAREVAVSGTIGVGVDVVDPVEGGVRLGIHTLTTRLAGAEIFQIRHDLVSYDHADDGVVAYHPYLRGEGRFLVQWRWPGNESELYRYPHGDGWFPAPNVPTELVIEATDFNGNTATLTIPLAPATNPPINPLESPLPIPNAGVGSVRYDCFGDWLVVTAEFDDPEPETPVLEAEGRRLEERPFLRISDRVFRLPFPGSSGPDTSAYSLNVRHPRVPPRIDRFLIVRRGDSTVPFRWGGAELRIDPDSPYGALYIRVEETTAAAAGELRPHGAAYNLWPPNAPVKAPLELRLPVLESVRDATNAGVFRRNGDRWGFAGGKREGGQLVLPVRETGLYAVMQDTAPPRLRVLEPGEGAPLTSRRPAVRASVRDEGSGVAQWALAANGQWLLSAYDPEEGLIEWERDEDLPAGEVVFEFTATDNLGNETRLRRTVFLTPEND